MNDARGRLRLADNGAPLLLARLVVGGAFVWLGTAKAADPVAFLKVLRTYELLPAELPWLLNALAVSLPWVEILAGTLLLLGIGLRGCALLLASLLCVFSLAIARRALEIQADEPQPFCAIAFDCGCGSGVERVCRKLPENAGLLLLCLFVLVSRSQRLCLRPRLLSGGNPSSPARNGSPLVPPRDPMEAP